MASLKASISKPSKKPKFTIIPPKQLFIDLTNEDTITPSPKLQESSPSAPSKTPSTKDTSSSSIDYTPKSPTSSTSLSPNGYLNPPTSPPPRVSPPPPTQENASMDITLTLSPITPLVFHTIHSTYHDEEGGSTAEHQFVPEWGLRDDLRISSFRACKEMITHLATPVEDEYLGNLSNMELVRRAYQSLGRYVLSQGELLKWHEWLNNEHVDLRNRSDIHLEEDDWRKTASKQVEKIKVLERELEPKSQQLVDAEEKVRLLKEENSKLVSDLARAEMDRHKLVRDFISEVVKMLHTSSEYRKSLAVPVGLCFTAGWLGGLSLGKTEDEIAAVLSETGNLDIEGSKAWKDKHRELFTKQYMYIRKVAESYRLPMDTLLQVSPDPPHVDINNGPSTEVNAGNAATQVPLDVQTVGTTSNMPPQQS
ncbi:hypothetical protein Tco_1327051 [Tanacetum coccineum]